jgi:hypothetical protein
MVVGVCDNNYHSPPTFITSVLNNSFTINC